MINNKIRIAVEGINESPAMHYQFEHFLVDKINCKLYQNGEVISDDEKTVNLLELLCSNYPKVVEKDKLIESLWPDQVVTDWSLSKLVSDVRQQLGDTGKDQGYIKTVRGKGFRLNAEARLIDKDVPSQKTGSKAKSKTHSLLVKALLILLFGILLFVIYSQITSDHRKDGSAQAPIRVAVLPVASESSDPIDDWIKYGIMSMASVQLAQYDSIQTLPVATVIGVASGLSEQMEEYQETYFEDICGQIGCSHLVLIKHASDINNDSTLSYQIFEKEKSSVISEFVQRDVLDATDMLLDHLVSDLIPSEKYDISLEKTFSNDKKANRDYAIGVNDLLSGDIRAAKVYLEQAIERVPSFFWAKAYLAEVHYRSGQLSTSKELIEKLKLEQPNDKQRYFLEHLMSNVLYALGQLDESLNISIGLQTNPFAMSDPLLMGNELLNIGSSYQAKGDLIQAQSYLEKSLKKYQSAKYGSGEGKALFNLANVFLASSEEKKAVEYYQKAREVFIRYQMNGYALMAKHQIATTSIELGRVQYAESELRLLVGSYQKIGDLQGELKAEMDLIYVSIAKSNYQEAVNRAEDLLPSIELSEFSYLKIGSAHV